MKYLKTLIQLPQDIELDGLQSQIPPLVFSFVESLFVPSCTEAATLKKKLLQTSISHVIMNATSKKGYISPLFLTIGIFIHQTTRSRVLIDVLWSLGLCASYNQVMAFERCAAVTKSDNDLPADLAVNDGQTYCQWVVDNFDLIEDTINGSGSTHTMGMISCHTPKINGHFKIPMKNVTAADIATAAKDVLNITPYEYSGIGKFDRVKIQEIKQLSLSVKDYLNLDTMWLISGLFTKDAPNWQGFMPDIIDSHFECSSVIINPMVPLNPETNEAICSTMRFVKEQASKMGMCCAALTFDQPLYLKANKIKYNSSDEFKKLHIRLGGCHQLMSFLGSGGKLLTGSGIEEPWGTVSAKNSIPKMLEGKAYTKCL